MKIWVITGHSESGDDLEPVLYLNEPTEEEKKELALEFDSDEDLDGPGDYGSYVYLKVAEREVIEN